MIQVHGIDVQPKSQCAHWNSERDIVAIKFPCCGKFYACFDCHRELADHPSEVWPTESFGEEAILCGACQQTMSIESYFVCGDACIHCQSRFNPGCRLHRHAYFAH